MRHDRGPAVWPARLRWRLRGATLWPLFAVLTVAEAVLLAFLPVAGRHTGIAGGLLLAMFLNLVAVAGVGRLLAVVLRSRRRDLPREVAEDRAGSILLLLVAAAILTAGLVHAPARRAADRADRLQRDAARAYVLAHGDPVHRRHLGQMDTEQESDDLFRTCVPGDEAAGIRPLCLLIDTSVDPPRVHVDTFRTPNGHL
jgi:hypothetical protein